VAGTLNGGQNEAFSRGFMGTDSVGRTLLSVRTRERLKVKMRVVLRAVSLALVYM